MSALTTDGKSLFVGGGFTAYRGVASSANRLAKLDPSTGAIDTTFSAPGAKSNGFDDAVLALALDGSSLYVGGRFTQYRGADGSASHLAKLDPATGAIDTTFSPPGGSANGFDGLVDVLGTDATSLYVGGNFGSYRGVANSANDLAKLDLANGGMDQTFMGGSANGFDRGENGVLAMGLDAVHLLVGGEFSIYRNESAAVNVAVLNASTGAAE